MGEMADFFLADVAAHEERVRQYGRGELSAEEAYEHGIIGEQGEIGPEVDEILTDLELPDPDDF